MDERRKVDFVKHALEQGTHHNTLEKRQGHFCGNGEV